MKTASAADCPTRTSARLHPDRSDRRLRLARAGADPAARHRCPARRGRCAGPAMPGARRCMRNRCWPRSASARRSQPASATASSSEGRYRWQLRITPWRDPRRRRGAAARRSECRRSVAKSPWRWNGATPGPASACNCARCAWPPRGSEAALPCRTPRPAARGFTLIEVLLATVLLAAGLALAFATLRRGQPHRQRGEAIADRSERMRAVEGFLRTPPDRDAADRLRLRRRAPARRSVSSASPSACASSPTCPTTSAAAARTCTTWRSKATATTRASRCRSSMVLAGETIEERQPRPPEVLVDGLREARFRYRALDDEDAWATGRTTGRRASSCRCWSRSIADRPRRPRLAAAGGVVAAGGAAAPPAAVPVQTL